MQKENHPYTLGLDIGMASIGAALLLPGSQRILALHVRTFDKAETAKEGESLNKIRRDARLIRRRIRRRVHRLVRLARLMKRHGLIDAATPESFALSDTSPWTLRAEGLDRLLEPKEWASVLYHLVKHRGFQSNRKSVDGRGRGQVQLRLNQLQFHQYRRSAVSGDKIDPCIQQRPLRSWPTGQCLPRDSEFRLRRRVAAQVLPTGRQESAIASVVRSVQNRGLANGVAVDAIDEDERRLAQRIHAVDIALQHDRASRGL